MMPQVATNPPEDRVKVIEDELIRLRKELKQTTGQLSLLQVLFLIVTSAVGGGGYYLAKEGMLRIEGFSPAVAKSVEAKDFGFYSRGNVRTWFAMDDKFGDPQIVFLNPKKQLSMRVRVWPDEEGGGGLAYYDGTGWRGEFRMGSENVATLNLVGRNQKGGISMRVDEDGNPAITLTDKTGKILWQAPSGTPVPH